MKYIICISIIFLIYGCQSSNAKIEISIIKEEEHPVLVDHSRILLVKNRGEVINKIKLYPETGLGQTTVIVDNMNKYTVIDCNGFWYEINKVNGEVIELGWKWLSSLPDGHIIKYKYNRKTGRHDSILIDDIELSDVYRLKDPQKP
jgi:hypothetical protein